MKRKRLIVKLRKTSRETKLSNRRKKPRRFSNPVRYWDRFKYSAMLKVYMTDFFLFARLNLPNVLICVTKSFFHSDFPFPCFDVPKASNFTSGEVQNRQTKNRRLGTIATSIQDSKPHEKQISPTFYFLINNALLYHLLAN